MGIKGVNANFSFSSASIKGNDGEKKGESRLCDLPVASVEKKRGRRAKEN